MFVRSRVMRATHFFRTSMCSYVCTGFSSFENVKDASSVSLYPYLRSQILQYVISKLNKLTLYKELQTFVTNNVFLTKSKNTTTKQKMKHKNPCWIRGLNPGPLAPKADALPLHHRVN